MRPYTIELNPGERKVICTCGQSKKDPLCDGSHKGTGCTPIVVHFTNENKVTISGMTRSDAGSQEGKNKLSQMDEEGGCCRSAPKSKLSQMDDEHGCCGDGKQQNKLSQMDDEHGCCGDGKQQNKLSQMDDEHGCCGGGKQQNKLLQMDEDEGHNHGGCCRH